MIPYRIEPGRQNRQQRITTRLLYRPIHTRAPTVPVMRAFREVDVQDPTLPALQPPAPLRTGQNTAQVLAAGMKLISVRRARTEEVVLYES